MADADRFPHPNSYPPSYVGQHSSGNLPPVDLEGRVTGLLPGGAPPGHFLIRNVVSYSPLANLLFGGSRPEASVVSRSPTGTPISTFPIPPYDALYSDPDNRVVKMASALQKEDINQIVQFYLETLGGFTLEAGVGTDKVQAMNDWQASILTSPPPHSPTYPLTRNLARITLMRRLIAAGDFIDTELGSNATWGDVVRSKIHDFNGEQRWPLDGGGNPIEGRAAEGGGLKIVQVSALPSNQKKGFQESMLALGGSHRAMLVLFPEDDGISGPKPPLSFFCTFPGNRPAAFSSPHFAGMMEHWVENELVPTHREDYALPQFLDTEDPAWAAMNPYPSPPNAPPE